MLRDAELGLTRPHASPLARVACCHHVNRLIELLDRVIGFPPTPEHVAPAWLVGGVTYSPSESQSGGESNV